MKEIILNMIYVCLLLVSMIIPSKHALHIFQQSKYVTKRYVDWLKETLKKNKLSFVYVVFIFMSLFISNYYVTIVFLILFSLFMFNKESKNNTLNLLYILQELKDKLLHY